MEAAAPVNSASHPKLPPCDLLIAFLSKAGVSRCLCFTPRRPAPRVPANLCQADALFLGRSLCSSSYGAPPGVLRSAQTLGITGSEPGNYFQGSNPGLLRTWPEIEPYAQPFPPPDLRTRGLRVPALSGERSVPATGSLEQPSVPADRHSKPGDGFSLLTSRRTPTPAQTGRVVIKASSFPD